MKKILKTANLLLVAVLISVFCSLLCAAADDLVYDFGTGENGLCGWTRRLEYNTHNGVHYGALSLILNRASTDNAYPYVMLKNVSIDIADYNYVVIRLKNNSTVTQPAFFFTYEGINKNGVFGKMNKLYNLPTVGSNMKSFSDYVINISAFNEVATDMQIAFSERPLSGEIKIDKISLLTSLPAPSEYSEAIYYDFDDNTTSDFTADEGTADVTDGVLTLSGKMSTDTALTAGDYNHLKLSAKAAQATTATVKFYVDGESMDEMLFTVPITAGTEFSDYEIPLYGNSLWNGNITKLTVSANGVDIDYIELSDRYVSCAVTGNHTEGVWETVLAPTSTAVGSEEYTCSVCGNVVQRDIAVLPHFGSIGVQFSTVADNKVDMRMLASINSLEYRQCGFIFSAQNDIDTIEEAASLPNKARVLYTTRVCNSIYANGTRQYAESDFGGKYLAAFTVEGILQSVFDSQITVTPFLIGMDEAPIYAESMSFTVNEKLAE